MKAIVAIGGGNIRTKATLAIDREIIRLSGKKQPRLLYIPTASSDSEEYSEAIQKYFGGYWGCKTNTLLLIKGVLSQEEIRKKILAADIIYVGGGNTLMMMRLWRRWGVDRLLRRAYERGVVLSGISAGSICWFDSGHSDSMSYYNQHDWKYINVRGLGIIKGVHCPHYDTGTGGVPRRDDFQKMISRIGSLGIAIDDNCAVEFIDGREYRVIPSKPGAGAYRVYKNSGRVVSEKIDPQDKVRPIADLYRRNK